MRLRSSLVASFLLFALLPGFATAQETPSAQDTPQVQWRNAAEITYLLNGGNAVASTLGLRNSLRRRSAAGDWRLVLSARRTDATRIDRIAVGPSPDEFVVVEERDRERTAERYTAETRYDRTLRENVFAFGGVNWERNELAGLAHRVVAVTGAGVQWEAPDAWQVKVGYGLTYTVRRDVVRDPTRDDYFAGLRITLDYLHDLREGTELEVKWVADANAQDFSETRGDLTQAVSAALTDRLSLKTTLQFQVENEPPLEALRLVDPNGVDMGEEVRVPLRRVDRSLSVAVVITL